VSLDRVHLHLDSSYLNMSRQQSALQLGSYHELLEFNLSGAKMCNLSSVVFSDIIIQFSNILDTKKTIWCPQTYSI